MEFSDRMNRSSFKKSPMGLSRIISDELLCNLMLAAPGDKIQFLGKLTLPGLPEIELIARDFFSFYSENFKNTTHVRIFRDGAANNATPFSAPTGPEDIRVLADQYSATIYLSRLQTEIPYLAELAASLSIGTHSNVSVNAFVSPRNANSTPIHYDYENLLIYQLFGRKVWRFYDYHSTPTFNVDGYKVREDSLGGTYQVKELEHRETFFIPKGAVHQAETLDSPSIHLVFNLSPLREEDLFAAISAQAWRKGMKALPGESLAKKAKFACALLNNQENLGDDLERLRNRQLFSTIAKYRRNLNCPEFTPETKFIASAGCLYQRWNEDGKLHVEYASPIPALAEIDLATYIPARIQTPIELTPAFEILERGIPFSASELCELVGQSNVAGVVRLMFKLGFLSIF
ncbi:JmjC domain-containing protein [Burkholderia gladioli]|uniref:JmjC domain-containing protein n=1 Tax=Burkholderia gladioli TaxID=28095 RepID=UPI00164120DF|nr:cupin domain-containing protein [Burkholderia gladioli]MDC6129628.1 cupin domain-containing protein [Burkholderia gladioli]